MVLKWYSDMMVMVMVKRIEKESEIDGVEMICDSKIL